MDDKITISTFQLFKMFPDQETARKYLEGRMWPKGVKCPTCGSKMLNVYIGCYVVDHNIVTVVNGR